MNEDNIISEGMPQKKSGFKDTVDSIVVAFVIAMLIKGFIIQAYKIPSGSMLDTLLIGDHILVNRLSYTFSEPKVNDIIVFEYPLEPEKDFIKRIVGAPGDKLKVIDKKLYRNGEMLKENFTKYDSDYLFPKDINPRDNFDEITVPKGYYFVMGDNRDSSFDSRFWGFVPKDSIKGKAFVIYWSWQLGDNFEIRFNRILKLIR